LKKILLIAPLVALESVCISIVVGCSSCSFKEIVINSIWIFALNYIGILLALIFFYGKKKRL
jgi:hypothetical protein